MLASKSISRRKILEDAGVPFDWMDADVNEAAIKQQGLAADLCPDDIAQSLADAKAMCGVDEHPDALILGCDQILVCEGSIYDKPATLDDARAHLIAFRGRSHTLISAITLMSSDTLPWQLIDRATLKMRNVSNTFIDAYLASEGEAILSSVGAYRLEERGIQLFDDIVGNYFTILGLPLMPLLDELRRRGVLDT